MLMLKKALKARGPLLGVGLVSILIVLTGALIMFGLNVSRSWDEEVKLIDGSTIVVKRHTVRERFGEIGHHGALLKQEVKVDKPGGAVHWVGDIDPVVFDFIGNKAYLVAFPVTGPECRRYGSPNPPFVFFEYSGLEWKRIRSEEFPEGFAFNLLRNSWYKDQPSLINLEMKQKRDWNPPEYFKKFDKNLKMNCGFF